MLLNLMLICTPYQLSHLLKCFLFFIMPKCTTSLKLIVKLISYQNYLASC